MPLRRDALTALAEVTLAVERIARAHGPNAVGTMGEAIIAAPSRNVIPGEIAFTMDIRSPDAGTLDAIDRDLRAAAGEIASRRKVEITIEPVWKRPRTESGAKLLTRPVHSTTPL